MTFSACSSRNAKLDAWDKMQDTQRGWLGKVAGRSFGVGKLDTWLLWSDYGSCSSRHGLMATAAIQGILFLSRSSIWVYTMYIVLLLAVIWCLPEHRPRPWPLQSPHVLAFRLCHPLLHLRLWVGTQDIMDSRPSRIWSKVDDPKHREGWWLETRSGAEIARFVSHCYVFVQDGDRG